MKRWIFKLVVFLLLGAIVNVGVAWACAAWSDPRSRFHYLISLRLGDHELDLRWITQTSWESSEGWRAVPGMPLEAFGIERQAFFELPEKPFGWSGEMSPFAARTRAGWPAQSLEGSIWFPSVKKARGGSLRGPRRFVHSIAIKVNTRPVAPIREVNSSEERALPLLPIWPGFAINTILYAAILWLPFAPFHLRRYVRVKHGRCIKCGYDLRGTPGGDVCPECGAMGELYSRGMVREHEGGGRKT